MTWLTDLLQRPAIAWWDLLDIAIVAVLIYELLVLIRGTRAVQMALSGAFLIGLFFVSRWLELETVNWVIRNLAGYVVFAIIVLFQSDIRRALAHFGRAPFFRLFRRFDRTCQSLWQCVAGRRRRTGGSAAKERGTVQGLSREFRARLALSFDSPAARNYCCCFSQAFRGAL